ncbi:unnamed protein product [Penicillium salamii]|nr:unnamed protein product [Penicillium salamii]
MYCRTLSIILGNLSFVNDLGNIPRLPTHFLAHLASISIVQRLRFIKMAVSSNFHFPIHGVSNDRLKLVPFDPEQHCETFFRLSSNHPVIYAHMPMLPPKSTAELKARFYGNPPGGILSFSNPESFAFAIIDRTRPASPEDLDGELAGTISFIRASATHLCVEIGFIVILPPYQRTHVATHAVGLALQLALSPPGLGGLGLCRVHWTANSTNLASVKLAERMGFVQVGMIPWHMRFIKGKAHGKVGNGKELPSGSDPEDVWRDSLNLSLGWDLWRDGAREKVLKAMDR